MGNRQRALKTCVREQTTGLKNMCKGDKERALKTCVKGQTKGFENMCKGGKQRSLKTQGENFQKTPQLPTLHTEKT